MQMKWACLFLLSVAMFAQESKVVAKDVDYTPTAGEQKSLQHDKNMIIYAMNSLNTEAQKLPQYSDWQKAIEDFKAHCEKVATDHKWPKGTTCDVNTVKFIAPPAPEAQQKAPAKPTVPEKKP